MLRIGLIDRVAFFRVLFIALITARFLLEFVLNTYLAIPGALASSLQPGF